MYFLFVLAGLSIYLLRGYINSQPQTYYITRKKKQEKIPNHFSDETFDENSTDYFNILIKVLILSTYNTEKFNAVTSEDFPFRRLEEDMEFVFTEGIFKSMLRNGLIKETAVPKLLRLKEAASTISEEEWFLEKVDLNSDKRWIKINKIANELLTEMNIETRSCDLGSGNYE